MKKLLMGVFGLGLMLSVVSVQAQTIDTAEGTASADVTVWNVDTPVYNVEIEWDGMEYNWVYVEQTGEYRWDRNLCTVVPEDVKNNLTKENFTDIYAYQLFKGRNCSPSNSVFNIGTSYEDVIANLDDYYYTPAFGGFGGTTITITDNSEKAAITPSIEWTSAENYDWTVAKFFTFEDACLSITEDEFDSIIKSSIPVYTDSNCSVRLDDRNVTWSENSYYYPGSRENVISTKELPNSLRIDNTYNLLMTLEIDKSKEIITPQIDDKIGTVTISIK